MEDMGGFWLDRPVCVTGATGLLGSWLVKRLVELGADVTCLVRDWVPFSEFYRSGIDKRVRVVNGDVRDRALVERILSEYETNTLFHLAAQTIVGVANANPVSTLETNIGGTWGILESCRRVPSVGVVIVASSDKAYGDQESPYNEDCPLEGRHPYDVSKSCADLIAQMYGVTYGLPVGVARCGNFYGGGDLNWNRIVPGTIRSVLRGQVPVIRSDGLCQRDYFYIEDAVEAYLLFAQRMTTDALYLKGKAFNFSLGEVQTVLEITEAILMLMNSSLSPEVRNTASNEIRNQSLDSTRARQMLGWSPTFTLKEGLGRTIEWYRAYLA